jgi:hypothetical protein
MTQIDIYRVKNSCMYIVVLSTRNRLSHHWKFDEPFGAWFHFERFLGTSVNRCEGRILG